MLWMAFGPPPGMPISPETTRFTGPIVGEYGLNTYAAVWEAKGWPREKAPHEWDRLMDPKSDHPLKYQHPYDVLKQHHETYQRLKQRLARPFDENEDPEFTKLVSANEPWYRRVLDSEPDPESPSWAHFESDPSSQFRLRAMLAFGQGNTPRGVESLRFMARLAENRRRWTSAFGLLSSVRSDRECWEAIPAILFSLDEPPPELCEFAFEFSEPPPLPKVAARIIDEGDRYHDLMHLCTPSRYTGNVSPNGSFSTSKPHRLSPKGIRLNWFMHRVDWRRFASIYHKFVDGFVERISIEDDALRTKAIADYRAEYQNQFQQGLPDLRNWQDVITGDVTKVVGMKMFDSFYRVEHTINWDRRQRRQVCLAVYLARFRFEHRRFPKSLPELAATIPAEHRHALRNSATGKEWYYECLDDGAGFLIKEEHGWVQMQWTDEP